MDSAPCERISSGIDETETEPVTRGAESRVGTLLKGKWRLDKLIGVGGMAAVYAATHRNSKRVAVKMLHAELSIDEHVRQRFLREGYVANRVGHRGAVAVDDDDTAEDGAAFLVMELLEGETLETRTLRKGGRLGAAEVLSLMDQVLDTLAAAHEKGIVHRDLKPENLFLTRDGVVKVLDFGIARLQESTSHRSATQAGSLMGTPSFMAPEQARGRWDDVDGRTDLWAVGATMFALLTGRLVHEAETVNEVLVMAVTERAKSLLVVSPDAHPAVMAVVDKALAYERENRYQTASEM
ncbi:MAG TPA: serine/threonine-protein kinase, partial [Polyangiaceae bacterium]